MNEHALRKLLSEIKNDQISIDKGIAQLKKSYSIDDLGFAKVDHHRHLRQGFPEVIYCAGKTSEQVVLIAQKLVGVANNNILMTRANSDVYQAVKEIIPDAVYYPIAKLIVVYHGEQKKRGHILVVSAGTSDMPVAEEAAITAEVMGNAVERIYDSGVAGIHRLLNQADRLQSARVIIAVAGMEGALPSVVGGLTHCPVIAVPTSVGYGASFGGLAALLAMLNSCASGVGVVNIDNGFGAGYLASSINQLGEDKE